MFQCSKIVVFLFLSFFFSNFEIPFLSVLSSSLCDKTQKHDTCHGGGGNTTTPAETSLDWRQKYSLLRLCGFHTAASLHHSNFQWHSPGKKELIKVITKQRSRQLYYWLFQLAKDLCCSALSCPCLPQSSVRKVLSLRGCRKEIHSAFSDIKVVMK